MQPAHILLRVRGLDSWKPALLYTLLREERVSSWQKDDVRGAYTDSSQGSGLIRSPLPPQRVALSSSQGPQPSAESGSSQTCILILILIKWVMVAVGGKHEKLMSSSSHHQFLMKILDSFTFIGEDSILTDLWRAKYPISVWVCVCVCFPQSS